MSDVRGVFDLLAESGKLAWAEDVASCLSRMAGCDIQQYYRYCDADRCYLQAAFMNPASNGIGGAVVVIAERFEGTVSSNLSWLDETVYRPQEFDVVRYVSPMDSVADDAKLLCVYSIHSELQSCSDKIRSHSWVYSGRFGEFVFTLRYGSDDIPISKADFVGSYVKILEGFIVENFAS